MSAQGFMPPQTLIEAKRWGWLWVRIHCRKCFRVRERSIDRFPDSVQHLPFGQVAAKLRCKQCESDDIAIALGCWGGEPNSPTETLWHLGFDGDRTIMGVDEKLSVRARWDSRTPFDKL